MRKELAEASIVLENDLPAKHVKSTHADELVRVARQVERWVRSRTRLKKQLKELDRNIKRGKKELKSLAQMLGNKKGEAD